MINKKISEAEEMNNLNKAILDNDIMYLKDLTGRVVEAYRDKNEDCINNKDLIRKVLNYNRAYREDRCFVCCKQNENTHDWINICQGCKDKL